jgi:multimeric flavodoxin WrbA
VFFAARNREKSMAESHPRKGMPSVKIDYAAFRERFLERFHDPRFDDLRGEIEQSIKIAWQNLEDERKAPRTRKAGEDYADPDYDLSVEWSETRDAISEATRDHASPSSPSRLLIINGSPRNEHTCPGEMSKTYRLVQCAVDELGGHAGFDCAYLDLSRVTAEYGRQIHPCKACFSTSPALCHWPCSCYPNHSLGQVNDWMAEIYPMWVRAHGIIIVTPCHWYQSPSVLKLMIDRLVCADGGNPDPSSTAGKDAARAQQLEEGWAYPRHLAGRVFGLVVHGDSAGIEGLRRSLSDWLSDMQLRPAGATAEIDRYIGYYRPYSTSHNDLDHDAALFEETRNVVRTVVEAVRRYRSGEKEPGSNLEDPRPK